MSGYSKISKKFNLSFFKKIFPYIILIFISLFIHFNALSKPGMYITHDGEVHILRSINFKEEILRGQIPVRMIPQQAYSYGYEVFNFFYPLPAYLTSIFQLSGMTTTASFKLMQFFTTLLSGVFFYMWLKRHTDSLSALTGSLIYLLVPFRIATIYVTGQLGGYLGLLFVPIILNGLYDVFKEKNKHGLFLSFGIAGLITSHLLSAIVFFIPLAFYTLYLMNSKRSVKLIKKFILYSLLGFGLSSFYFIPFMIEKKWIRLGNAILVNHRDHWPTIKQLLYSPWGYGHSNPGPNDGMTFQIGFTILVSSFVALLLSFTKKLSSNLTKIMVVATLIIFYLMTDYSRSLWELIVPLQLVQYPWRLLASTSLIGSILIGLISNSLKGKNKYLFIVFILALGFYNVRNYLRAWPNDWRVDNDYINNTHALHGPTDISWELTPINVTQVPSETPEFVVGNPDIESFGVTIPITGSIRKSVNIKTVKPTTVELSLWSLPVWKIYVNDKLSNTQISENGTVLVNVPEAESKIEVVLVETPLEKTSNFITVLSFLILIILYIKNKKNENLK